MTLRAVALGRWISGLDSASIPPALEAKVQDHILDTIGAAIVGDGRTPVRIAESVFAAPGAVPVLINAPARDLRDTARINAIAAHAAEIDDTEGCDHTGAIVVPTLLALFMDPSIELRSDALLRAAVAGYEVGRRMQMALGGYDAANGTGWHSTATCGVFAAAAAAAHALGLTPEQCTSALAIAASSSAGGWAFASDGSMTKQLHVANAAGNGLQAALLARAGATGPAAIFDEVWGGFFTTHGRGAATPNELLAGLGSRWHAAHSAIKMYAACRSAHPPLDGVVNLLTEQRIDARDVATIEIHTSPLLSRMICATDPRTVEAARMSLPVSIAFLLLGLPLDPDTYEGYRDGAVSALLTRVQVVERDDLPSQQWVEVSLTVNGPAGSEIHLVAGDEARGAEGQPFSRAEVQAKFRRLTVLRIGAERAAALIAFAETLGTASEDADEAAQFPAIWSEELPAI